MNRRQKSTIRDVAAQAGVSITTVSHALSGARPVHPETAAMIWRIAEQIGYRPSRLATQLRKGSTGNLGLILPDMSNESFTAVARAIHDAAFAAGYHLLIRNSDESPIEEMDAVQSFLSDDIVDGIILIATHGSHDYLSNIVGNGARIVGTNRPLAGISLPTVARDDEGSAYLATRHLMTMGHQRLAALAGRKELLSTQLRLAGMRRALEESGLQPPKVRHSILRPGDDPHDDARRAAIEMMNWDEPPTAIFSLSQRFLEGAVLAFRELGVQCPDDVALISYGRARLAAVMHPVPTIIDQDAKAFGQTATSLLLGWLETDVKPESVTIKPTYVLGDTCGWRRFFAAEGNTVFSAQHKLNQTLGVVPATMP